MARRAGWMGVGLTFLVGLFLLWPDASHVPEDRPLAGSLPPPAGGELRIVVVGTSLTARYDWPDRLETALMGCLDQPVEVETLAKAGASIAWGTRQAATILKLQPDLVLIEFAINDADLRDGVGRGLARELTAGLVAALAAAPKAPQVALMTMSPAQGLRGWLRPWLARHYADYRVLAASLGVGLIDLYPRWLDRPRTERGLGADGLHPDFEIAADVIVPALTEYVGAAAGRACGAV